MQLNLYKPTDLEQWINLHLLPTKQDDAVLKIENKIREARKKILETVDK